MMKGITRKILWMVLSGLTVAAFPLQDSDPRSAQFRKQFLGSYGVLAPVEPSFSKEDRALYERVLPFIESNEREAIRLLESGRNAESSVAFDFLLGNLYYSLADYGSAERALQRAIKAFPSFQRAYRTLALIQVQQQEWGESVPHWLRVIALGGGDGQAYGLLAYAYLQEEQYQAALTAYEQARMFRPESRDFRRGQAECLLQLQRSEEAMALMDAMMADGLADGSLWLLQAQALLSQDEGEKREQAIAYMEMGHAAGAASYASYLLLGDLYLQQELPALAVGAYGQALLLGGPWQEERWLQSLRILLQGQWWPELAKYAELLQGQAALSKRGRLQVDLALIQLRWQGEEEKSEAVLQELQGLIEQQPLAGEAYLLLAQYYREQEAWAEAEFYLQRASKLEGFVAQAAIALAELAVQQGQLAEAAKQVRRALLVQENAYWREYLERIEAAL